VIEFICNLCGTPNSVPPEALGREVPSCTQCGSTVRMRALTHLLSMELFGVSLPMTEFPRRKGLRGLGMSDSPALAAPLEDRFDHTNTFYHREPRFDVLAMDERNFGRYDFIVCSEVLEHIPPPPERGFETLFRMLKPRGVLLLTVPYTLDTEIREHFPDLDDFTIAELRGGTVLVNKTADGRVEIFDSLVFHGGGGSTLEMRRYTESALRAILADVGFESVRIAGEAHLPFGILHGNNWSLPIAARKGPFVHDASDVAELVEDYRDLLKHTRAIEKQFADRTVWAQTLEKESQEHVALIRGLQAEFEERTQWALKLQAEGEQLRVELQTLRAEVQTLRGQPWVRVGRRIGLV
jgi:SAM-dependent methyltransferase